jgi:peroxiredoxin
MLCSLLLALPAAALEVGELAPDAVLPWADAQAVHSQDPLALSSLWKERPLVLFFFPMAWSPG